MSFEPDDEATVLRQLREEIAKIREENFSTALPTNNIGSSSPVSGRTGVPLPAIGITSIVPEVIFTTKDTGVIDLLNFDGKNLNKDFTIGETITGQNSGATAEVGDIDTLTDTTGVLTLVPSSITGTFNNNENLNGSGAGGNNIADADGTQFTQTGRGHLVAGAGSIIASAENVSAPFEIHFIDNAGNDGQTVYIRALEGQTIRMRRAITKDTTTGNLDLDESFDIIENGIVFFQFQVASNVSEFGGWVPQISEVTAGVTGGTGGTAFTFPILYPKETIGPTSGVIDLLLNQSNGHYKQITLNGDASLTFSSLPPSVNGFKFYVLTIQDNVGGHVYTDLPNSVLFEGSLLSQLQTDPNLQTLWQFSTADGGTNWHASVINPQGSVGQSQTPWLTDIDADTFSLLRLDQIRFFGAGGFGFPTDATVQGIATSGTGLQRNVPLSQSHQWFVGGDPLMQLTSNGGTSKELKMFQSFIENTSGISFFHPTTFSSIIPIADELRYDIGGIGSLHAFRVGTSAIFPQFEIREDVVRVNVDLDMITNNIINIDQAQFDFFGGFEPLTDHGERRITGGAQGISMNIPESSPFELGFNIFFENEAKTTSEIGYQFLRNKLRLGFQTGSCVTIEGALALLLCNGGSLTDTVTRVILNTGQNPAPPNDPQLLELSVSNQKKVEFTNLEDGTGGAGGGMKMFTDLNMQTQNINNVDILDFEVDSGVGIFGAPNGTNNIVAFDSSTLPNALGPTFLFNIPPGVGKQFAFSQFHQVFITMDPFALHIHETGSTDQPKLIADGGFRYGSSFQPEFPPTLDGDSKLINNAGSLDVVYRTGGKLVNLSDLTATPGGLDIDNDLGTVGSQAVEIDWDVSNFHRMILNGDVTVGMTNLPNAGEWQEVTVQFLQDNDGGHEVSFIDTFTNGVVPRISQGTNRYTTVKFYSYDDGFERILAFNVVGQINELTEGEATPFFQGIIQARMANDQTSNTAVGDHLEFDTVLFSDKITVSSTGGQGSGIFSGFIKGRTYECECAFAVTNNAIPAPSTMAIQFFDRATSTLIGTHGKATAIQIVDQFQQVSKAYFVPDGSGDTLEVQIIAVEDTDTVLSGSPPSTTTQRPMSYVTIKDCGISEGRFNEIIDEDLPESLIPPPPAPIGFSVRSVMYNHNTGSFFTESQNLPVDGAMRIPFLGENAFVSPLITVNPNETRATGKFMATTPGRIRNITWLFDLNSLNKDMVITLMENEEEINTLFTIPAGATGKFEFNGNVSLTVGNEYWVKMQTIDKLNTTGNFGGSFATVIYWGFAD